MFRTFKRTFLPNPFDRMLKRCAKKGGKRVLLFWNRGLGDIALGLYAMVERIYTYLPNAEITFLTRENLKDGFSLLKGVKTLIAPGWKRGEKLHFSIDRSSYDLVIENPNPTEWVFWQHGKLTPRLEWNCAHDELYKKFQLEEGDSYIGVQIAAETPYGFWRNWPLQSWSDLFVRLSLFKRYKILLFGFGNHPAIDMPNVIDLRGKTTLFELLSIIKNRCQHLIVPDSGILSMVYYLDAQFPLQLISLWADPKHGILKQNVASPNCQLQHVPLIGSNRDLSQIKVDQVLDHLAPLTPLQSCPSFFEISPLPLEKAGAIILAGGQGTRLGVRGPKGLFPIKGKSLFEWICEKAPTADFPISVMTSPLNHEATVAFFREKNFFGREIHFFCQPVGLHGPDGNGSVFHSFHKAGLIDLYREKGAELVFVVPVENPLADPADCVLATYHRSTQAEVTIKCVKRDNPDELMGALVERVFAKPTSIDFFSKENSNSRALCPEKKSKTNQNNPENQRSLALTPSERQNHIEIIEYLDLNPKETYRYNNTGMMAMNLSFMQKMSKVDLAWHEVKKKVNGKWVIKQERFIFDALKYANSVQALCYPRQMCYAPLKKLDHLSEIEKRLS